MKTKEELLKIYSAYLPYELNVGFQPEELEHRLVGVDLSNEGLQFISPFGDFGRSEISEPKPILYSMNMLTKLIEHNGETFIPWDELTNGETVRFNYADFAEDWNKRDNYSFENYVQDWILGSKHCFDFLPYGFIQKLIEWHFNVFGLEESEYIKKEELSK
jgi:hypothetical protein